MDMNKLTQKSQEAVQQAQAIALRYGHQEVDGEHLLASLLAQDGGLFPRMLTRMQVDGDALKSEVEKELARQLLDDGRLTDAQGHVVDFKNTVVIMTSNIGSPYLLEGVTDDGEIRESARDAVMAELRQQFRPEFLNRIDDVVLFKPLLLSEITKIVDLLIVDLRNRLSNRQIDLTLSEDAKGFIARKGFDPVFGARPLKRFLQHELETRIGRALISGDISDGTQIEVDVTEDGLVVKNAGGGE